MTKMNTLSAVIILFAAVAAPVFAQEMGGAMGPGSSNGLEPEPVPTYHGRADQNFRGAKNQLNGPSNSIQREEDERNIEDFGFSGRDPSRVGGEDPSLNPPD
jgi:hypothetical protein